MLHRVSFADVGTATFQRHDHFHFKMHVIGLGRVGELAAAIDIVAIFLKKERGFFIWVMPHLNGMVGIIAPDAINTTYRETGVATLHREAWLCRLRNYIIRHFSFPLTKNNPISNKLGGSPCRIIGNPAFQIGKKFSDQKGQTEQHQQDGPKMFH